AVVTSGIDHRLRDDVADDRGRHARRVIWIVLATGQRGGQRDVQPYLRRSVRIQVPQTKIRRKADRRGLVVVCALFRRSTPALWAQGSLRLAPRRRRQSALGDLVEQRLVADLEITSRLGAIPPHAFEHFCQGLALGCQRATARDLPQALGDGWRGSRGRGVTVATP